MRPLRLFRLRPARRDGQRGAAAVEFALSLFFLVPLLLGIIDFGYHFYIAINVVEAQHAGLVAAVRTGVTDCSGTASLTQQNLQTTAKANALTALTAYLHNNSLDTVVTLSGTTAACSNSPLNPTWSMTLVADFRPVLGRVMPWDKASTSAGYVRYTAHKLAMH